MRLVDNTTVPDRDALVEIHQRRRRLQLARLLQLTEEMLEHAQAGEWEILNELEEVRRAEMSECFDMQQDEPSLLIAEALNALLQLNDQIVALVEDARQQVVAEHNREFQQKARASQYLSVFQ